MFEFKTEIGIVYIHFILLIAGSNLNVFKCTQPAKIVWETCITSPGIALAGNRYQQELTGRSVSAVMYINHDIIPVRSSGFFCLSLPVRDGVSYTCFAPMLLEHAGFLVRTS